HASGIVVADLLLFRAALMISARGLLQNVMQDRKVRLVKLREAVPIGILGRHGVLGYPPAARILEEVGAGIGGLVHRIHIEAVPQPRLRVGVFVVAGKKWKSTANHGQAKKYSHKTHIHPHVKFVRCRSQTGTLPSLTRSGRLSLRPWAALLYS